MKKLVLKAKDTGKIIQLNAGENVYVTEYNYSVIELPSLDAIPVRTTVLRPTILGAAKAMLTAVDGNGYHHLKLEAIKLVKNAYDLGLNEAKEIVEELLPEYDPRQDSEE